MTNRDSIKSLLNFETDSAKQEYCKSLKKGEVFIFRSGSYRSLTTLVEVSVNTVELGVLTIRYFWNNEFEEITYSEFLSNVLMYTGKIVTEKKLFGIFGTKKVFVKEPHDSRHS